MRKLSRQLCIDRVWCPKRHVFDSALHAPPTVSWRPHVSATIVASTSPSTLISADPVVRKRLRCARIVFGGAVAVLVVVRVVTQRVDRLRALEVDDAQSLPGGEHPRPRFAGQLHVVVASRDRGRGLDSSSVMPSPAPSSRRCSRTRAGLRRRASGTGRRRPGAAGIRDLHPQRTGRVARARVEHVRGRRDRDEHAHLGAELDGGAGPDAAPASQSERRRRGRPGTRANGLKLMTRSRRPSP